MQRVVKRLKENIHAMKKRVRILEVFCKFPQVVLCNSVPQWCPYCVNLRMNTEEYPLSEFYTEYAKNVITFAMRKVPGEFFFFIK